MDLVDFPTWWAEFHRDPCANDPHVAVQRLCQYIDGLAEPSRLAFLENLLDLAVQRGDGWHLAWDALGERHDAATIARVAPLARTLVETLRPWDALPRPLPLKDLDDRVTLAYGMRILACSPGDEHLAMVERFLLQGEMEPYWYLVADSLWPQNPGLYSRAWCRYFSEMPVKRWCDTGTTQSFLFGPDRLACVRDRMLLDAPSRWPDLRASVLRHAAPPWVKEDLRRRIASVCGDTPPGP